MAQYLSGSLGAGQIYFPALPKNALPKRAAGPHNLIMAGWIRILSWALIVFAAPGLMYSLVVLDWINVAINAALLVIGVLDLRNVALMKTDRELGRRRMSWTQLALGFVVGGSFAYFGASMVDSALWDKAREIIESVMPYPLPEREWQEAMGRSKAVMRWGTVIGGVAIFISQVWFCLQLRRPEQPPPLPAD